ncbi:MAG TPA: sigma-70 family RNA polymerase sigma factor [Candidatus Kapabacteria bacterium]|nr:sigma-70 family RNA polymerase sigma factor [Candidatus Kapabacteria bacterium]
MQNTIVLSAAQHTAITDTVRRERRRLLDYIRRRVPNEDDAEDILQDVFYQFASTMQDGVISQTSSWLYRVAGNRIIDWYRKKKTDTFSSVSSKSSQNEDDDFNIEDLLFDDSAMPDQVLEREMVWDEISSALDELPDEQREAFIEQEIEGRSFKELSEETGVPINTLISRKRYAVLSLREQLRDLYDQFFE